MELNSRQLSSLDEMGITVWEFRTENTENVVKEPLSPEILERVIACPWLVVLDVQLYGEAEQRLLYAMLFSIGLSFEHIVILSPSQFDTLEGEGREDLFKQKIAFVLGERLLGEKSIAPQHCVITRFSLTELLNKPELKAQAWHDLQLAKKIAQQ